MQPSSRRWGAPRAIGFYVCHAYGVLSAHVPSLDVHALSLHACVLLKNRPLHLAGVPSCPTAQPKKLQLAHMLGSSNKVAPEPPAPMDPAVGPKKHMAKGELSLEHSPKAELLPAVRFEGAQQGGKASDAHSLLPASPSASSSASLGRQPSALSVRAPSTPSVRAYSPPSGPSITSARSAPAGEALHTPPPDGAHGGALVQGGEHAKGHAAAQPPAPKEKRTFAAVLARRLASAQPDDQEQEASKGELQAVHGHALLCLGPSNPLRVAAAKVWKE